MTKEELLKFYDESPQDLLLNLGAELITETDSEYAQASGLGALAKAHELPDNRLELEQAEEPIRAFYVTPVYYLVGNLVYASIVAQSKHDIATMVEALKALHEVYQDNKEMLDEVSMIESMKALNEAYQDNEGDS